MSLSSRWKLGAPSSLKAENPAGRYLPPPFQEGLHRDDATFIPLASSLLAEDGSADHCWSRQERGRFRSTSKLEPSQPLISAIRRYEKLHKLCTEQVTDWTALLGRTEAVPTVDLGETGREKLQCKFFVYTLQGIAGGAGLGNKLVSLVSGFLYALATDRVFLIDTSHQGEQLPSILCNPLPESSWWSPLSTEQHLQLYQDSPDVFVFRDRGSAVDDRAVFDYSMFGFFCEDVQAALEKATWLIYTSFHYQGSAVFAVPRFRSRMQELFPDNQPFAHLARYLLYPSNAMWDRISRAVEEYIWRADSHVAVQIRDNKDGLEHLHNITERVVTCLTQFGAIPEVSSETRYQGELTKSKGERNAQPIKIISLLATSLKGEYQDALKAAVEARTLGSGTGVAFVTMSREAAEKRDLSQTEKALQEIWLLSFSDTLFVTHMSTFGYLAAALAGNLPISMNVVQRELEVNNSWITNGLPMCERALTLEPCMHLDPDVQCDGYVFGHGNRKDRWPEVQRCRDVKAGIVMYPTPLPTQVEVVNDKVLQVMNITFE